VALCILRKLHSGIFSGKYLACEVIHSIEKNRQKGQRIDIIDMACDRLPLKLSLSQASTPRHNRLPENVKNMPANPTNSSRNCSLLLHLNLARSQIAAIGNNTHQMHFCSLPHTFSVRVNGQLLGGRHSERIESWRQDNKRDYQTPLREQRQSQVCSSDKSN